MIRIYNVGDVIFQERPVPGLPYPTGVWAVCRVSAATAYVALVSSNKKLGTYAIDNWYKISLEDFVCFSPTGETACIPEPSPKALEQESDWD